MVDYYEELNLNQGDSVSEINRILTQLESTWKRREINSPEKSTKMMALIIDARSVFKSDASKAEYDKNLSKSKEKPTLNDSLAEREEQYQYWMNQVKKYYDITDDETSGTQKELAWEALKKAAQYKNPDTIDTLFSIYNSFMYFDKGDYQTALTHLNEAILAEPNNPHNYILKADSLGRLYFEAERNNRRRAYEYVRQFRATVEKALSLFSDCGDVEGQKSCYEKLAAAYIYTIDDDYEKAKHYAQKAIETGSNAIEMVEIVNEVDEHNSHFQPYQGTEHPVQSVQSGCFIATAVYGSYDCPEVWTLRRYRDYFLANHYFGRLFIRCYYTISPMVVKHFGSLEWFNRFWRPKLDRLVNKLNQRGYSAERYNDD